MLQRSKFPIVFFTCIVLLTWGCKKDKDEPCPKTENKVQPSDNEQGEQITTVRLTFTNQNDLNDVVVVNWKDLDGNGGLAPSIDSLQLKSGVVYNMKTEFLDEVNNKDVTQEIKTEGEDHQVFYVVVPNANFLDVTISDKDAGGKDLGLEGILTVQGATADTGILRVTLKHQPGKKDGNINTGTTDIEAEFPVEITAP